MIPTAPVKTTRLVCPAGCEFEHALMGVDPAINAPPIWFCDVCMRPLLEQEVIEHQSGLFQLAWQERWKAVIVLLCAVAILSAIVVIV